MEPSGPSGWESSYLTRQARDGDVMAGGATLGGWEWRRQFGTPMMSWGWIDA